MATNRTLAILLFDDVEVLDFCGPSAIDLLRQTAPKGAVHAVRLDGPAALEVGGRFAVREGGKTVGPGVVTEVAE